MKRLLTILLLIAAIIPCSAKKAAIKREQTSSLDLPSGSRLGKAKMGAYLMVYHKDCDHSLHMAISYDGYTWTALRDDKPVFSGDTIAVQHGIRDPHIFSCDTFRDDPRYSKLSEYRTTEWKDIELSNGTEIDFNKHFKVTKVER